MKNLLFLFLLIASQSFAQRTIASKDIADVVLPNAEVELFYGNANFSADHIVVLPEHIVIYNAEEVTFHLLDKKSKLNLFNLCLYDVAHINTRRINFGETINGKFRTIIKYRTPFIQHSSMNTLDMYSLSDTSIYAGLIRVKRDLKIAKLFVENDSLKLDLLDFDAKKSFPKVSKKEKRKKIVLDYYDTRYYNDYVEFGNKKIFSYRRSPYEHKKNINYKSYGSNCVRDSSLNFNSLFYKTNSNDTLKLFYQNTYENVSKVAEPGLNFGYFLSPRLITSKNKLILWNGYDMDSLIVFDNNLRRLMAVDFVEEVKKNYENHSVINNYFGPKLFKDEFTEKIYIYFKIKEGKQSIVSELNISALDRKISFRYLRTIQFKGAWIYPLTINKGIMYMGTENGLIGNNYVYKYDLYEGLKNKDEVLEIAFKNVKTRNEKVYKHSTSMLKYEKYKPLTKKIRKKYFKGLNQDTAYFKQSTHIQVLESFRKAVEEDSIRYALSFLMLYNGVDRLEMEDDIKAKNLLFFDLMVEYYSKEEVIAQADYLIKEFASFETEMYKNRMMVRTPDDLFFNLYKVKGLWYIDPTFKSVKTVENNESANYNNEH